MDKKTVYVIQSETIDGSTPLRSVVIGVTDSPKRAIEMVKEYYKEFNQLSFRDIRDSGLEWELTIEWWFTERVKHIDRITLLYFNINEL